MMPVNERPVFTRVDAAVCREAARKWIVGGIGYDTIPLRKILLSMAERIEIALPPEPDDA